MLGKLGILITILTLVLVFYLEKSLGGKDLQILVQTKHYQE